jgi:hypothetical protein
MASVSHAAHLFSTIPRHESFLLVVLAMHVSTVACDSQLLMRNKELPMTFDLKVA